MYQSFDLVTKLKALPSDVPPIFVEFAIFGHVPQFHGGPHWTGVSEQVFSFHLHEDLLPQGVEWSVAVEPAGERLWSRARDLIAFWLALLLL